MNRLILGSLSIGTHGLSGAQNYVSIGDQLIMNCFPTMPHESWIGLKFELQLWGSSISLSVKNDALIYSRKTIKFYLPSAFLTFSHTLLLFALPLCVVALLTSIDSCTGRVSILDTYSHPTYASAEPPRTVYDAPVRYLLGTSSEDTVDLTDRLKKIFVRNPLSPE